MAEQPPLNRSYVISYAANDRDFPTIGLRADPRVAGYRVPEDLSPHPDSKRYPNHVFTGSQPSNGDERVTHVYEILPSPWVPFTRYDDDLGPVQGRRRSVKNEGQEADLAADKKISYEGREGSAIVSNEIEETWSIKTDEDGNSLFPIRDRDFYDASRGAVQERRQLFVPTGEEDGTLENINGVITQTSYEPYNEFLSIKIIQTYKVNGPQLIGRATDNDGQLVTVTTQRKGALNYIPPSPTATRTVEVNREDAESLIERIVDTPEIFASKTFSVERPDPIPQKFRVAVPLETDQEIVVGDAEVPVLQDGDISRSEEQRNKFLKRVSSTSRDQTVLPQTLLQKSTDNDRQEVTITETLQVGNTSEVPTATKTIESEALGDGNYVIRKTEVPEVFDSKVFQKTKDDLTPQKFRGAQESNTTEENVEGIAVSPTLLAGQFAKSEQQVNKFVKRVSTTSRAITQAVTLLESVLTPEGQIGTRTSILSSGDQSFVPSALLIDANVEALGDGRTVKTETTVPRVFDRKSFSIERIDSTPEKFRFNLKTITTQETLAGIAALPELADTPTTNAFAASEQQVTEFIKTVNQTSREIGSSRMLSSTRFVSELGGGYAVLEETYPAPPLLSGEKPDLGTLEDSVENLGNGKNLRRKLKINPKNEQDAEFFTDDGERWPPIGSNDTSLPILKGQDYDEELDIVIPYKQVFADPKNSVLSEGERRRITPRDIAHNLVIKYDIEDTQSKLDEYYWEIPDMINVQLPDKLLSVTLHVDSAVSQSESQGVGDTYTLSVSNRDSVGGSISYRIEQGFNGLVPTIRSIFFLPKTGASPQDVLAKINSKKSGSVSFWPNPRPRGYQVTILEKSNFKETSESVSFDSVATSESSGGEVRTQIASIPPTIHGSLTISSQTTSAGSVSAQPSSFGPTNFPQFPTGLYLYQINATPYKFSYVRVDALLVQITSEYV
jgi:hypothetical protein